MRPVLNKVTELLERFEGCSLKAYQDIVGVWTIGYGETKGVTPGMEWTQEQADNQLRARAFYFIMLVYVKCPQLKYESSDRVAACVSLAYNIGINAFGVSSVCRNTQRKNYQEAANSFLLWNKAGGIARKGLTWRRQKEREIYLRDKNV